MAITKKGLKKACLIILFTTLIFTCLEGQVAFAKSTQHVLKISKKEEENKITTQKTIASINEQDTLMFQDPCQYITYTVGMEFHDGTKLYIPFWFNEAINQNNATYVQIKKNVFNDNDLNITNDENLLEENRIFNDFERAYTQYGLLDNKEQMEKMATYAKLHPFALLDDYTHIIDPKKAHVFHIHFLCFNHGISDNHEKGTVFLKQEVNTKWYKNNQ